MQLLVPILYMAIFLAFSTVTLNNNRGGRRQHRRCLGGSGPPSPSLSGAKLLSYLCTQGPYRDEGKEVRATEPKFILPHSGCEASKIWYFGRHGTRYPSRKEIMKLTLILPSLQSRILDAYESCEGSLSHKQYEYLRTWEFPAHIIPAFAKHLANHGNEELSGIGKRFRMKFPNIFKDPEGIRVLSSRTQRTIQSSRAFVHGTLGLNYVPEHVFSDPPKNPDPLVTFWKTCKNKKRKRTSQIEKKRFDKSHVMNSTVAAVTKKLGLDPGTLSSKDVVLMYIMCAYETAWNNKRPSPWCGVLDEEHLKVLAYREDMRHYYEDGYGRKLNVKQGCSPFKDLISFMNHRHRGTVQGYFSHKQGTLRLLARLGLFRDPVALTSEAYEKIKNGYLWRTSDMNMMATNLAFVLYECKGHQEPEVGFFFMEKRQKLPQCGGNWHCPLSVFSRNLANIVGQCDLKEICEKYG